MQRSVEEREKSMTDITKITVASQISIWRMGQVIEGFYCKAPLVKKNPVNVSQRLFCREVFGWTPVQNVLVTLYIK